MSILDEIKKGLALRHARASLFETTRHEPASPGGFNMHMLNLASRTTQEPSSQASSDTGWSDDEPAPQPPKPSPPPLRSPPSSPSKQPTRRPPPPPKKRQSSQLNKRRSSRLSKYRVMLKMRVPRGAVEHKMRAEGLSPSVIDNLCEENDSRLQPKEQMQKEEQDENEEQSQLHPPSPSQHEESTSLAKKEIPDDDTKVDDVPELQREVLELRRECDAHDARLRDLTELKMRTEADKAKYYECTERVHAEIVECEKQRRSALNVVVLLTGKGAGTSLERPRLRHANPYVIGMYGPPGSGKHRSRTDEYFCYRALPRFFKT